MRHEVIGYSVLVSTTAIREATVADSNRLAELRYEFRSEVGGFLEDKHTFIRRCSAWMASSLSGHWKCWAAVCNGEIVGQVWAGLVGKLPNPNGHPELHGYISNLYVRPECRGGVGSKLLAQALAWLKQKGVDVVILWPTPRSRTLYKRHGLKEPADILELR